jgi:cysteinyl-tRNA synthetase
MLREAIASDKADMADEAFRRETDGLITSFYESMDDDFDTPQALASLFSLLRVMNSHLQKENPDRIQLQKIEEISERMLFILGLEEEKSSISDKKDEIFSILSRFSDDNATSAESALELLIEIRTNARKEKDYEKSDRIRDLLESAGIILEDDSGKARWRLK